MQIPKSSRNYATPKLAQYRQLVQLTVETLATAITTAIQDQGIGDRAAALGEKIRSENGVAHAVEIIEKKMNKRV